MTWWMWALLVHLALQMWSRWSITEWNSGLQVQLKGSPFDQGDWEWFDWIPRHEDLDTNTEDELQQTVRYYRARAWHGRILFLRYSIRYMQFQYEMTRREHDELVAVAPTITYDHQGRPAMSRTEKAKEQKHAELKAKYCKPGRRVKVA